MFTLATVPGAITACRRQAASVRGACAPSSGTDSTSKPPSAWRGTGCNMAAMADKPTASTEAWVTIIVRKVSASPMALAPSMRSLVWPHQSARCLAAPNRLRHSGGGCVGICWRPAPWRRGNFADGIKAGGKCCYRCFAHRRKRIVGAGGNAGDGCAAAAFHHRSMSAVAAEHDNGAHTGGRHAISAARVESCVQARTGISAHTNSGSG